MMASLQVEIIPALKDNYSYVVFDSSTREAIVIDACEAKPISAFLESHNLQLKAILTTHHHYDHVGGNAELYNQTKCQIICSQYDFNRVPAATNFLHNDEELKLLQTSIRALAVPGHTHGALAYYFYEQKWVFTGDTLFTLGCGRLFEGTHTELQTSLMTLSSLPEETLLFCGHEYGLQNLSFSLHCYRKYQNGASFSGEKLNMTNNYSYLHNKWQSGQRSVPTTIAQERKLNLFLQPMSLDDFIKLRTDKDNFRLET